MNCYGFLKLKFLFFLLQNEMGDIFRLIIDSTQDTVHSIRLVYFDTLPLAVSLCMLRTGHLFVACEKGNHILFNMDELGD